MRELQIGDDSQNQQTPLSEFSMQIISARSELDNVFMQMRM
jgi:hypothetical protein